MEAPMNGIVLKRDGDQRGLAFISGGGLRECIAEENGDLSVTLIRSFGRTIATNGEAGGQELFTHHYRFLLVSIDETVSRTDLQNLQDRLMAPPEGFVTVDSVSKNLFRIDGKICVSALKPAEDNGKDWILRLYNVEEHSVSIRISSSVVFRKAVLCNMLEREISSLSWEENQLLCDIPAGKIITIRFCKG